MVVLDLTRGQGALQLLEAAQACDKQAVSVHADSA